MASRQLLSCLLGTCIAGALLPAQVALAELAQVARARAERARPAQEAALEPFWTDLAFEYKSNAAFLEPRLQQVAALGDSVVPLLLEKLQPAERSDAARHLAGNCRRVLERMDPASFVDALVEYLHGKSDTARDEAVRLLGAANTPQATAALVDQLQKSHGEHRRLVLRSLQRQQATSAAPQVVGLLGSSDRQLREDVLQFLIAAKPTQVADTVIQALGNEKDQRLWPLYIDYFAAAVREHDAAALALLPLLGEKLEWQDLRRLIVALATVAPRDHEPTIKRLQELLENTESNSLSVHAATTLRALGDSKSISKVKRNLDEQLRRRKKDAAMYEQRANLCYANEDYADAIADYERVLEFTDGLSMSRRAHVGIIRSELRRKKWSNATKQMKASGMTVDEIAALGYQDPVIEEALAHDSVRRFLQALAKEQAPK